MSRPRLAPSPAPAPAPSPLDAAGLLRVLLKAKGRMVEGREQLADAILAATDPDAAPGAFHLTESCAMGALRAYRKAEFDVLEAIDAIEIHGGLPKEAVR